MAFATYLALNISEWYYTPANAETTLWFKAYAAATPAKYCNFSWDATTKMYNSTCCISQTATISPTRTTLNAGSYKYYTNDSRVSGTCASTATTAEIKAFDTVDIMYGTKSFYTLNSTTLSSYDITAAQIKSAAASFKDADFLQYDVDLAQFKLYWVSFGTTDISKLKITLTDSTSSNVLTILKHPYLTTDAVTCYSYGTYNLSAYDSITGAILYTKKFTLTATTGIIRNVISDFKVVAAPTDSQITTSGDSVLPITVRVNLTAESETGFKSASTVTYLETGCSELYLEFTNNDTVLQAGYTNSLCYYAFVSNTNLLVPGKFTITAYTVDSSGVQTNTVSWTSSTQLTPAMIGSWVVSSSTTTTVIISASYMSDNDKLTGGAIAAIVIGSFCGAVIIIFFLVLLIRFCAYGCAQRTTTMM